MGKEIKGKWWILAIVAVIGGTLDIATKYLAVQHLTPGNPVRVLGDTLEFLLIYNKGAIFGLDPRALIPGLPFSFLHTCFMIVAIVFVLIYYRQLKKSEIFLHWGLALVIPGAIGNLYDRILHPGQGVVDFIKVDVGIWPFNPWPIFNLADVWITIAVGLIIISFLFEGERKRNEKTAAISTNGSGSGDATEGGQPRN